MIKNIAIVVCLSLPLISIAAESSKGVEPKSTLAASKAKVEAARAAKESSRPSGPVVQRTNRDERLHQQARGAKMGACQKNAADQNLGGVERKQFMVTCLKSA
jgi:hypothetical protein